MSSYAQICVSTTSTKVHQHLKEGPQGIPSASYPPPTHASGAIHLFSIAINFAKLTLLYEWICTVCDLKLAFLLSMMPLRSIQVVARTNSSFLFFTKCFYYRGALPGMGCLVSSTGSCK